MSQDQNIPQKNSNSEIQNLKEQEVNENISQEQTIESTETANPTSEIQKSETENMEVHHHPNLHHRRKHWKEYFLEFLMIFLAVTLGFFAENIREHFSNKETEKQNIIGVIKNLEEDSARLVWYIQMNKNDLNGIDSFLALRTVNFNEPSIRKRFYTYNYNYLHRAYYFVSNDASIEQMKSSGTLRFISKQSTIDSILMYNFYYILLKNAEDDCKFSYNKLIETGASFLNGEVYKKAIDSAEFFYYINPIQDETPQYEGNDSLYLREYYYYASMQYVSFKRYTYWLNELLNRTEGIISYLKQEYNLENE